MADKTKVIRVFETFAGIGAQHKAISNIKKSFKVVGTSEWDVRAMMAYANIHNQVEFKKQLKIVSKWEDNKINDYLDEKTFSLNSKVPGQISRKPRDFKVNVVAANIANNNFPDINKIVGENIKGVDLLTYSFPCQGLSIANMGRGLGIKRNVDSTSNLIWQIKRLLDDSIEKKIKLPKYLLMENVTSLIGKNHKSDYHEWKKYLKSIGYKTYTFVLNGLDHGALQKRKRVFGLSIQEKYVNNKLTEDQIKNIIISDYSRKLSLEERKSLYKKILSSSLQDEINDSIPNNTPSRVKMMNENLDLVKDARRRQYIFNTLTTKQDRHPNIGMISVAGSKMKRFITPREGYMIMGFDRSDFTKVKPLYKSGFITKESLYRQGGNSIVVQVLESIFKFVDEYEKGKYE